MNIITYEEYQNAVISMCRLAQSCGTSSSFAAAQVVLSAHNGNSWQLDVTDLCNFDLENYKAAMMVIRGRCELRMEPHSVIEDGQDIFRKLWKKWERYHVDFRWLNSCNECYGTGKEQGDEEGEDYDEDELGVCSRCDGLGLVKPSDYKGFN